ncbi:MAG: hypothetical protein M3Y22_00565 [Pseudomonadota bacterium]|nr:hypothetical protein [Pseudomonadota bacterium]
MKRRDFATGLSAALIAPPTFSAPTGARAARALEDWPIETGRDVSGLAARAWAQAARGAAGPI